MRNVFIFDIFGGSANLCLRHFARLLSLLLLLTVRLQDAMRDFPDSAHLVKGRALVQLEDHETGPAVWAASLATGKTPRHELHPQAPTPSTQANADGMGKFGGNAEGVGRLASLTPLNLQLLQRANSSNHRSSSLSSSSSSSSPISAVKHRHKSSGDGGGSDDDGSGCAATGAAAADTVSSSRRSFRSASRRLRQSWSMDARSPHPSSDPDGSGGGGCGGIGCPLAEATERGGVTAAEAHESFSLTDVTALSQPGSPLRCPPTDQAMQAAPDTGEVRKGILRRFVRPQACVMDELQGGTAPPGQSGQPSPRPHHYHHQQQHHRHQEQQQQLLLLPGSLPDPDPDPDPGQILPESCVVRGQRRRREEPAGPSTGPQGSMRASCVTAPPPPPCEAPGGAQARFSNRVQDELGRDLEVRHEGDDVPIWDLTADGGSVGEPLRRIIKTTHDGDPVHGRTSYNGNGHDNNNNNGNGNGNGTSGGFLPGSVTSDDVSVCALRVAPGWSAHGLRSGGDVSARVVGSAGNGSSRTVRHGLDGSVKGSRVGPEGALHRIGCDGSIRGFKPHGDSSDLGFGAGDGDSSVAGFRSGGDGRFLDGYDFISLGVVNRSGFRAECADLSVDGIDRMRSRASSTTGMETMRDDVGREDRDLRPPNLLVLHGQPFLGLDPLGPVFDEVATRAAAAAAEQQLRRRMRGGDYHIATTAAATAAASGGKYLRQVPGNSYGSAAYGGHDTTRELVRPAGVWEVGRRVRRSSLHVISSGPGDTKHRLRLASDGGGPFQEANSSANFRAEEQPRIKQPNRDDDSRCAVLEKQLAEAQRQMEVLFANPLQVPAFEAALRREVDAVTARLNGQMMAQLHKLQAMLHTVSAHAEDLSSQVTSVDDRLQRLEDEQHVTGAAAMAVMAAGISNGGRSGGSRTDGTWDGRDGPDALSIPGGPLGLKGPQAPPPVLLPLSTLNANTSNRFSLDAGRLMLTRQLSMRHTRRLSALEYGTLPDSEPLVDGGAPSPVVAAVTGGAAGLDAQPLQAMTVEDAALLAATVQRAVGSTSRRRRSALELSLLSYSSLMTTPGHEALQLLQPAQLPAIRSSQGQRLGTELDIGTGDDGDGGGGDDGSGGVTGGTTAPKQAISLSLPVEPTADGPPPGLNWRAASLRRSGRRTSWAILASQSLGLEGNSELDPVATVNGASASGGSGGGGGSLRPNDGVAGSPEPPARPLLPVDTARQHQLVNNIQRQVSFLADGLCLNDKQSSSCGCYSDISNTGASNDGGGSRGGSCEISVVKEYVMQQPLQSSGRGPALRRSKSNVQDRPGSGGGGVGNTTATKRRLSFRRSLTSVLREGSQRAQQTPMGGPRMSTISELRALLGFH
ncbi:hypothetical protein Vafri_15109 [Volvox africanus]|nr:hypothetical protein Vafri_15109 [Volvox africanus]